MYACWNTCICIETCNIYMFVQKMVGCFSNGHVIIFPGASHLVMTDLVRNLLNVYRIKYTHTSWRYLQPLASVACIAAFSQFPGECRMEDFQYLLPFDPRGESIIIHMYMSINWFRNIIAPSQESIDLPGNANQTEWTNQNSSSW